jgi:hypothetical protein
MPCEPNEQLNPATADLDDSARALAALVRYAASHPDDSASAEIRENYDLFARLMPLRARCARPELT